PGVIQIDLEEVARPVLIVSKGLEPALPVPQEDRETLVTVQLIQYRKVFRSVPIEVGRDDAGELRGVLNAAVGLETGDPQLPGDRRPPGRRDPVERDGI